MHYQYSFITHYSASNTRTYLLKRDPLPTCKSTAAHSKSLSLSLKGTTKMLHVNTQVTAEKHSSKSLSPKKKQQCSVMHSPTTSDVEQQNCKLQQNHVLIKKQKNEQTPVENNSVSVPSNDTTVYCYKELKNLLM